MSKKFSEMNHYEKMNYLFQKSQYEMTEDELREAYDYLLQLCIFHGYQRAELTRLYNMATEDAYRMLELDRSLNNGEITIPDAVEYLMSEERFTSPGSSDTEL